jgi:predicted ATP-dependent serine protease
MDTEFTICKKCRVKRRKIIQKCPVCLFFSTKKNKTRMVYAKGTYYMGKK